MVGLCGPAAGPDGAVTAAVLARHAGADDERAGVRRDRQRGDVLPGHSLRSPPVGNLRWMPPQPVQPSKTILQATQLGPGCPSPGFPAGSPPLAGTSEDCLTLVVQTRAGARPGQKLPVMFEIHGGGFLGEALDDNGANFGDSSSFGGESGLASRPGVGLRDARPPAGDHRDIAGTKPGSSGRIACKLAGWPGTLV